MKDFPVFHTFSLYRSSYNFIREVIVISHLMHPIDVKHRGIFMALGSYFLPEKSQIYPENRWFVGWNGVQRNTKVGTLQRKITDKF